MGLRYFKNFAVTTLGAGFAAGVTTNMNLGSGGAAKLPIAPFVAIVWNSTDYATPDLDPSAEVVLFTSVTSDTVNAFTRAQEGTADVAHNTGGKTYKLMATVTAAPLNAEQIVKRGIGVTNITNVGLTSALPG